MIASWLLDLTAVALVEDAALSEFAGRVSDSGEGRLDNQGRHRRGRAGTGPHHRAVRALHLARRGGLSGQTAVSHALPVRRARGKEGMRDEIASLIPHPFERERLP